MMKSGCLTTLFHIRIWVISIAVIWLLIITIAYYRKRKPAYVMAGLGLVLISGIIMILIYSDIIPLRLGNFLTVIAIINGICGAVLLIYNGYQEKKQKGERIDSGVIKILIGCLIMMGIGTVLCMIAIIGKTLSGT